MSQAAIILPGTLTSTAGLRRLMELVPLPGSSTTGFPAAALQDLYLFNDGSGATPANSITARPAGAIAAPAASLNSYSWASGGGLQLNGTEVFEAPALALGSPWSVVIGGTVVGGSIATGTGIFGLFSFLNTTTLNVYGSGPAATWTTSTATTLTARSNNTGGSINAFNAAFAFLGTPVVLVLTFDGVSAVTAAIYSKTGAVIASVSATLALSVLTSSGGASQQPCIGISSGTYNSGQFIAESMFAPRRL